MKLVYVAGKYTADTKEKTIDNVNKAVETAKIIFKETGFIFIVPHKITELWDYDDRFSHLSADDWLELYCYPLLSKCDYLVVSNGLLTSYGVEKEIEFAIKNHIPVFYSVNELLKYVRMMNNEQV